MYQLCTPQVSLGPFCLFMIPFISLSIFIKHIGAEINEGKIKLSLLFLIFTDLKDNCLFKAIVVTMHWVLISCG